MKQIFHIYNLLSSFLWIQNYEYETNSQSVLYNFESLMSFEVLRFAKINLLLGSNVTRSVFPKLCSVGQ